MMDWGQMESPGHEEQENTRDASKLGGSQDVQWWDFGVKGRGRKIHYSCMPPMYFRIFFEFAIAHWCLLEG